MKLDDAINELKSLQQAFGFYGVSDTQEYNYLRDDEPENYKTALAIETVLNYIENSIPKEVIEDKIKELRNEFNKLDEEIDKYLKEDNKDLTKYYEQRERIAVMQTIGWAIGKFEEILEGK